jgi:hypothetical protein
MNIIQLPTPIPVRVVGDWKGPTGKGMAIGWFQESIDHHLTWLVFMDDTGQCWEVENPYIRARENLTWGRPKPDGANDVFADGVATGKDGPPAGGCGGRPGGIPHPTKEDSSLREALSAAMSGLGLCDEVVALQLDAVEEETWEPVRIGRRGDWIAGYRCKKCQAWLQWPGKHPCKQ